jgi:UV excision repair protein RAD23
MMGVAVLSSMSGGAPASTGPAPTTTGAPTPAPSTSGSSDPLAVLRSHPQLNQLKRLVQSNPSALPVVLEQIGKASPQLLSVINSNRDAFVALLNEPIGDAPAPASTGPAAVPYVDFGAMV